MPDKTQQPMNLLPSASAPGGSQALDAGSKGDLLAKQELARITPSNEELLKIASKCGPLPKWLDEDEPLPR